MKIILVDEQSKEAKSLLTYLKSLSFVTIVDENKITRNQVPNETTLKAIKESVKKNKRYGSVSNLMADLDK